jgi:hypothetical protein
MNDAVRHPFLIDASHAPASRSSFLLAMPACRRSGRHSAKVLFLCFDCADT